MFELESKEIQFENAYICSNRASAERNSLSNLLEIWNGDEEIPDENQKNIHCKSKKENTKLHATSP